jgi:hypothetical protein
MVGHRQTDRQTDRQTERRTNVIITQAILLLFRNERPKPVSLIPNLWWHLHLFTFTVCHTTSRQPLPQPVLHTVPPSASSFNFQYPFFSLRSSSSCLRLFYPLPVTSIHASTFPSITCFIRQFLSNIYGQSNQLSFLF